MDNLPDLLRNLTIAWTDLGGSPVYHSLQVRTLSENWPTLYKAVLDLVEYQVLTTIEKGLPDA